MFKVTAKWHGKLIEELFITKNSAQHFADRLWMSDTTSQPTIEECKDVTFVKADEV